MYFLGFFSPILVFFAFNPHRTTLFFGRLNTVYAHMLPVKKFDKIVSLEVARPEKASKFDLFQNCQNQNLYF